MQAKDGPRSNPKGKVATKPVVEARPPPPINIQNFVDKKLQPTKRIEMPASEKFPNAEDDANNWSISVMTKYLKEKLELPQYAESFERHEIDGLKFISMNESNFVAAEVGNKFHAMKLTSHAELLRELVLEKAHIDRPDSEVDWSVAHVAAWLTYDKCCPDTALCSLKAKLNGYKLKDLTGKQAVSSIGAADLPEAESATVALDGLAKKVHAACVKEDEKNSKPETHTTAEDAVAAESETEAGAKLKKKKKTKTAIQKRREKQQQDEAGQPKEPHSSTQDDLQDSDSELNIIRNDSLPAPEKKKGNTSNAFSSAMSNIFAEVHDIASSAAVPATKPTAAVAQKTPSEARHTVDESAYGKVDLSETDRSAAMKAVKVPPANPENDLERELSDAKFEEIQRGDQEDPDVFRMEGYKKSKERKKFTSKIASLRKIVAEHAQTMHELREQAHILKSENLMIKEQQKMLLREGGASQELIATLVHDRNIALLELEKVVSLYDEHTSREREEVVRDLRSLARDTYKAKSETEDIWRNRSQQMAQLGILDVGTDVLSPQRPTTGGSAPARKRRKGTRQRNGDSDSSGSDLEDEVDRTVRAGTRPISAPVLATRAVAASAQATVPPPVAPAPAAAPHVVSTPASKVSLSIAAPATPAPEPISAPSSIHKGANHPLAVARTLLATSGVVAHSPTSAPATGTPPTDLMRMVDRTADTTLALWQGILRTYRVPRGSRVEHYSDNKLILRSIAVPWQRLGHQMLQDAHSADNKDVRKALKGLEKCAKKAVVGATRAAKRALESTTEAPKSTTNPSKTAPTQNVTGALKKNTRSELGSSAFPVDDTTPLLGDGSAGSTEEVNCHHRAAGMVFGLALVNRIMHRYSAEGEDKTQLLYLLNKVNHGELPVTEVSRDNMRDFLDSHIGIDLKWDKFDSVCQKLDPDRNGFISTPSVILAFSQLTPLSDRAFVSGHTAAGASASSGFDPEFGELMLLSIATGTMARPKQAISEAFMSLILHNSKSSASFATFIQKEHDRVGLEDKGYVPDAVSPRSSKITPDARVAEQQLFATDIFYELTKEFVYKAAAMPDLESRKLPKSSKQDLKESQKRFLSQKRHVSFLCQQHHEACGAVARGVQVYAGGSRKALVDHLSTFVLTFLSFRRKVVTSMLETARSTADPANTGLMLPVDHHSSSAMLTAHTHASAPALSVEQLEQLLLAIETNIATLTGLYKPHEENNPTSDHYSPMKPKSKGPAGIKLAADVLTLQEYDLIIAELLGIPLPKYTRCDDAGAGCCTGMAHMQAQVETVLFTVNQHFALEEALMVIPPEPPKPLASSLALKDLQQTLFKELWQGETPIDETLDEDDAMREHAVSPAKSVRATHHHIEGPPIHVVEEVNARMHKQRVEQATHYLEILNDKAVKRKKAIRGLMNLWQAAKMAVTENNKISKFASASEIEHKRQIALPVEDILFQTKSIQTQLVADMQEKSTTKLSQLSQRINLLRQGIASQTIPDEDLAVTAQLREISLLENALLQANADAMRLAARIVQQLTSKKETAATAHAEGY